VTAVAAAGNESVDIATAQPAGFPEVIATSALTDYDGKAGGRGTPTCFNSGPDDGFASFSNFGSGIALAAPGTCILSTLPSGQYGDSVGTSMSAPHATGAAALFMSTHASATPTRVRAALLAAAEPGPLPGDPDAFAEDVMDASRL
jgi:subtilisin